MLLTICDLRHLEVRDLLLGRAVAQKQVLHLHMANDSSLPLTLAGMGLLGAHFLIDTTWTPQELDKMRQVSVMRTRIEWPSTPWA